MQLFSSMGRFLTSIMPSSRESDCKHLIYAGILEGNPASLILFLLQITRNSLRLLGHLVVVDMQVWKETKYPEHEFIVARVVRVKEADTLPSYAKGSNLARVSILIGRTDREREDPLGSRSRSLSSRASSESATSASQHGSADPQPILDSHVHSESAPDLSLSAHIQEYPPVSVENANPVMADDDGAEGSTASRTQSTRSRSPYDKFNLYPGKSIRSVTWNLDAVCMATMDFTTASKPLLFEELAMMVKVTSDSEREYLTPTTHAYWHAAMVWGMAILHTGATPEHDKSWLRPLLIGAPKGGPLPAHVFGVDDELKPAELLETFSHQWDQYKAGLIRDEKLREEAILREVYESRIDKARKLVEEQTNRIAELERMLAQLDGTTSA